MSTQSETYVGKDVTITIVPNRCIHARNCVLGRPDVWVPNAEGPWVHPDAAPVAEIVAIAQSCPSGAIQCERSDGMAGEQAPLVNTVRIRENGPLSFHAALSVNGDSTSYRATLCRCGASRNKPYCDGSHHDEGFVASAEPPTVDSQPLDVRNGPVDVTPLPNGPLMVAGSVEMCSGTGRTVARAEQLFLCRCGGSANKPFCDGSHTHNGFRDR